MTVGVVGLGLIGGSLLRAVRQRTPSVELRAWARREASVEELRSHAGLVDLDADLDGVAAAAGGPAGGRVAATAAGGQDEGRAREQGDRAGDPWCRVHASPWVMTPSR